MSAAAPAPTETAAPASPSSGRGRSITAVICVVLAGILTIPAGFAFWGQRTINDGQRYIDTVGPLVNDPEIQQAIATKVTDAIEKQVDVEALLTTAFSGVITDRPRLEALIGPISGAVNGLIEREVQEFVASDAFESLWITANQRAQQVLYKVLNGEESSSAISVQGDEIVLDVSEVIEQVKQRLVDRGLTILDRIPLPDNDRQIVLLEAPELKQVKNIYAFTNPVARWLIVVVALLYLGAFVLARRRPRMTVVIGAVLAVNGLFLAWSLSTGQNLFSNQLAGTVFGPASEAFYNQLLTYLDRGQTVILWLGLILIATGWFAGRNSTGSTARRTIRGGLESVGASLSDGPVAEPGRWVAANARWLRIVTFVLGVVILLWGGQATPDQLFWAVVFVIVVHALIQVLIGAGTAPPGSAVSKKAPTTPEPTAGTA